MSALQDQLGLKLQPRKATILALVIDHVEKMPTENSGFKEEIRLAGPRIHTPFTGPRALHARAPHGWDTLRGSSEAIPQVAVQLPYGRLHRQAETDENERLQIGFAESHAAAVKHTVIMIERTIGRIKRYLQLTTVMAAKQRARAHTVTRMTAKVSAGRPPSCHANTAANR